MNFRTSTRIARFGRNAVIIRDAHEPLTEGAMRANAPTLFAEGKHSSRSERYSHIPTFAVLEALAKEGFRPYEVRVGGSGDEDKRAHTKHLIRLRHDSNGALTVGGAKFEVILRNSHDGTSAYALMAGFFRMVCSNGLVTSDGELAELKISHKGDVVHKVIEGTYQVLDSAPVAIEHVREMEAIQLSQDEQRAFAQSAAMLRWAPEENGTSNVPVSSLQVIYPRRHEDADPTLWNTFNRAQESLVNGGLNYSTRNARGSLVHRTSRPVRNIDGNVTLNRALWALTERMRELKSA